MMRKAVNGRALRRLLERAAPATGPSKEASKTAGGKEALAGADAKVRREHCSHVRERLFTFTVRKYCSESNTV